MENQRSDRSRADVGNQGDGQRVRSSGRMRSVSSSIETNDSRLSNVRAKRHRGANAKSNNALVLDLVQGLYPEASNDTKRSAVQRVMDAPNEAAISTTTVMDRIMRKLRTSEKSGNRPDNHARAKMAEYYQRLREDANMSKKSKLLVLLYHLMDTASPPPSLTPAPSPAFPFTIQTDNMKDPDDQNEGKEVYETPPLHPAPSASPSSLAAAPKAKETNQVAHKGVDKKPIVSELEVTDKPAKAARTITDVDQLDSSFSYLMDMNTKSSKTGRRKKSPTKRSTGERKITDYDSLATKVHRPFGVTEVSEQELISATLYALQGVDSRILVFVEMEEQFVLAESASVSSATRDLVYSICELGAMYRKVFQYVTYQRELLEFGVIGQSFCHALSTELSTYYRFVASLSASLTKLTLHQLHVWMQDPLDKMRLMARLIDSAEGMRGGALASRVNAHVGHGDPQVASFVRSVLQEVCQPLFQMIRRWVCEGELDDIHSEFFIVSHNDVTEDDLWANKYALDTSMLPNFISLDLAKQILLTGKSINFIRQCCGHTDWVLSTKEQSMEVHSSQNTRRSSFQTLADLQELVERVSKTTNKYLMSLLWTEFNLLEHCAALKRYLLLGQGDFIQYLMDLLAPELSKRASHVYRHSLTNVLDTALSTSNAKHETEEVKRNLDVELHRSSPGDTGWDVFVLHYRLTTPLNAIIGLKTMDEYQKIFHFLWQLKRVEHSLSTSWTRDMNFIHMNQGELPWAMPLLRQCQLLRSEMGHFSTNLHSYMMFEVLETAWERLLSDLKKAQNLDELIQSHEAYLHHIQHNTFMLEDERETLQHLKTIFATIIRFCKVQEQLYATAFSDLKSVRKQREEIKNRTAEGSWGMAESESKREMEHFGPRSRLGEQINAVANDFQKHVMSLLEAIQKRSTSGSESLSFLTVRFDFNGYYQRKMQPQQSEV